MYQHRGEYFIFVLEGLMFSSQPGESPGVVPNALVYSCSLVISKVRRRNLNIYRVIKCYFHIQSI